MGIWLGREESIGDEILHDIYANSILTLTSNLKI